DNVFNAVKRDYPKLVWTVEQSDENLGWHFDKSQGSFSHGGRVLFWYGADSPEEVKNLIGKFISSSAAQAASSGTTGVAVTGIKQQARTFSTMMRPGARWNRFGQTVRSRGFATSTNPNPPMGD